MPKWTKFFVGWALAALLAVALSWGAVAQVRNRVIQPSTPIPATSLAAAEPESDNPTAPTVIRLEPEVDSGDTATTAIADGETSTTASQPASSINTTSPVPSDDEPTPGTSVTTTTSGSSPSTTTSTTTTTSAPAPATTTTTTSVPATQTSSYQLLGGEVTISYSPGLVNFISAFPQAGYSTDIREYGPEEVRVRFESSDHTSDFRARWENGELEITKNETGDD